MSVLCTSYIKWVYCCLSNGCTSLRKLFEFPLGGWDYFVFLHLDLVGFLVLSILGACTARVERLNFPDNRVDLSVGTYLNFSFLQSY
jgi:hypothetical protein